MTRKKVSSEMVSQVFEEFTGEPAIPQSRGPEYMFKVTIGLGGGASSIYWMGTNAGNSVAALEMILHILDRWDIEVEELVRE